MPSAENKGMGLFARKRIAPGTEIFSISGRIRKGVEASPFSIQVGPDEYLDLKDSLVRYINHSCSPNCRIHLVEHRRSASLVFETIKPVGGGEEICFDYNTTEFDMESWDCAFNCCCESGDCAGRIAGFRFLTEAGRIKIRPFLMPYLLDYPRSHVS